MSQEVIKIVTLSYKRPNKVFSTKCCDNVALCVPRSQEDDYKKYNPDVELIVHPDEQGYDNQYFWLRKHLGSDLFILDDDYIRMRRMYLGPKDKDVKVFCSSKECYEIIQTTALLAKDLGAKMFSFSKEANPVCYSGLEPFKLTGYCLWGCSGIMEDFDIPDIDMGVDAMEYVICGYNAHKYRKCLIDNRYSFEHLPVGTQQGGMAEFRSVDGYRDDLLLLKRYFGDAIEWKKKPKNKRVRKNFLHEYEKTLKVPF